MTVESIPVPIHSADRIAALNRWMDFYYRNLRDGLCSKCGKERLVSATLGAVCLEKHRALMSRQREKAKSFRKGRSE